MKNFSLFCFPSHALPLVRMHSYPTDIFPMPKTTRKNKRTTTKMNGIRRKKFAQTTAPQNKQIPPKNQLLSQSPQSRNRKSRPCSPIATETGSTTMKILIQTFPSSISSPMTIETVSQIASNPHHKLHFVFGTSMTPNHHNSKEGSFQQPVSFVPWERRPILK